MADTRRRNVNWIVSENRSVNYEQAQLAVLMDIRDELQELNRRAGCYRIPLALDAMRELGAEARRKKRTDASKRKAKRERAA